jgi:apolipoprotein N-acyltransferase
MRIRKSVYSLPVVSGVLLILCQPPVSFSSLAYVALVPLFFSLEKGKGRHNFLAGFSAGIVCYAGLVYWVVVAMNSYGGIGIPFSLCALGLLVLYLALYTGCFTWLTALSEDRFRIRLSLSAPVIWVLLEYLRGTLLSGFPWSLLAHSQYNVLPLVQVVSITGTYFLSFLIVAANCLIYYVLSRRRFPLVYGGLVVLFFAACLVFGAIRLNEPMKGTLKASIVQGNIRQDVKFDEAYKTATIRKYAGLSLSRSAGADLIIWPETAMPFVFLEDEARRYVDCLPAALSSRLLLGTISRDPGGNYYNTAYVIGRQGQIEGGYSKVHLVPFGEYTPLTAYFPFLRNMSVAAGDFSSGPAHEPIVTGMGKIGVLICFEGVFPDLTGETVRNGAEVLVNITNDAWYNRTSAPYQHFAFYIFRAVETDRYVLRAANTGISAIIDPRGRVLARTGIFEERVLNGPFSLRHGETIYVRYGDYFVFLAFLFLCALLAGAALRIRLKARQSK